jgi:serine/threonine-protein kinase
MATVFLAEDTVLNRRVALKMVHPHLLHRPETVKRFHNEAYAVATLSHDNIVKVFDYGEEEDRRYLVMEYVDGVTLADMIADHAPMPNLILLELVCQILSGLSAAHEKGVCHRDIKPGNVMVDRYGCVRIMDFGIAYLASSEQITMTGTFVGSPNHISPEQGEGRQITGKTDVFSLGTLAYQCATGRLPFDAENPHAIIHRIVNVQPAPAHKHNERLLLPISDFIATCLIKDDRIRPDAEGCLDLIRKMCDEDHLELGRRRLVRFMEEPAAYRLDEERELSELYKKRAREEMGQNRAVSALKKLNQAKAFAPLSPADQRWAASLGRRAWMWRAVAGVTLGLGLLVSLILVLLSLPTLGDKPSSSKQPPPAVSLPPVIPASRQGRRITRPDNDIPATGETAVGDMPDDVADTTGTNDRKSIRPGAQATSSGIASTHTPSPGTTASAPTRGKGYLCVRTRPSWVTIVIDGIEAGNTAKSSLIALTPGTHRLGLVKQGFADYHDSFTVTTGDTIYRRIRMEPVPTTTTDALAR